MSTPVASVLPRGVTVLYGHGIGWYRQVVGMPLLISASLGWGTVLAEAFNSSSGGNGALLFFISKVGAFFAVGIRVVRRGAGVRAAALAGGITGLAVGIAAAFARLTVVQETWTIFNLITEPAITGVMGYVLAAVAGAGTRPRSPTIQTLRNAQFFRSSVPDPDGSVRGRQT